MKNAQIITVIFSLTTLKGAFPYEEDTLIREMAMNTTQEIEFSGYPAENYKVTTDDGYILQMQRIPFGKAGPSHRKATIFLLHGIGCDSAIFVDHLSESLGFQLADAGFDVWLGNMRGNKYGRQHKILKPDQHQFWDFSWDDIALKDVPALLNCVLDTTKANKIFYGAISLGYAVGSMLLAAQPQWNDRIIGFLGLVPVTRLTYTPWVKAKLLGPLTDVISLLPDEVVARETASDSSAKNVNITQTACSTLFCGIWTQSGYNPASVTPQPRDALYGAHCESGTSLKTFVHGLQLSRTRFYTKYNNGAIGNFFHYHSGNPPAYDLSRISVPVALFTAENDPLANPLDIARLLIDLPNVYYHYTIPDAMFSHSDITGSRPSLIAVYKKFIEIVSEMNKSNFSNHAK